MAVTTMVITAPSSLARRSRCFVPFIHLHTFLPSPRTLPTRPSDGSCVAIRGRNVSAQAR
jgi:hypothetical protein